MPLPSDTRPVAYVIGCGVREGEKPPVAVRSGSDDQGWFASITWPGTIGGCTIASVGPYASRPAAVLALREHLRERRVQARLDAAALAERRARSHRVSGVAMDAARSIRKSRELNA